jgi:SAM-dependent methyltransferase
LWDFLARSARRGGYDVVTHDREQRYEIERSHFDSLAEVERSEGPINATLSPVLIEKHIVSRLGDLAGKRVVECGCGTGQLLAIIALRGADTYGFDLSDGMVALARKQLDARGLGNRVTLEAMTLEHTKYASESFDLVVGVAVLHHTDLAESRAEVWRILKPGGRGLFFEPMRGNPIIALFRALTPKLRTPTEVALSVHDIAFFAEPFFRCESQEFYLTGLMSLALLALFRKRKLFDLATRITEPVDRGLLATMPILRRFCGFAVVEVFK